MSKVTLPGSPQGIGDKYESVFTHAGPASYTQIGVASPPTGGDVIKAVEAGLKFFEFVESSLSDDGQYTIEISHAVGDQSLVASVVAIWCVAATGAQVNGGVNLSGRTVRLRARGF